MNKTGSFLQKNWVVVLLAGFCCLLWGSAFPVIKIGYRAFQISADDTAAQLLFAGCRFTLAGILAVLIGSAAGRRFLVPTKTAIPKLLLLCLLQTVIQYLFFYVGLAHTNSVKASIIEAMNVFVAILVSCLLYRLEKLTLPKILGCLAGFTGVVLVNLNGLNFHVTLTGEGFLLFSTVAYAFSSVLIKRYSVTENPVMLSGYQFILGGLVLIAIGLLGGGQIRPSSSAALWVLLYLAMLSAVAYSLWGILLKYNPVSKVTIIGFTNPVFGVILSLLLLDEQSEVSPLLCIVALLLVCLGITIVNRPEPPEKNT